MARAGGIPLPTITDDRALGAADIQRSLRFNDDDSPYLERTPSGAGSNQMTFSFWIKRGNLGSTQAIFSSGETNARGHIYFTSDDKLNCQPFNSSGANTNLVVDRVFRDVSAWYHVVLSFNNTAYNDTASTVNVYVNGVSASFTPSVTNTPTGGNRLNDSSGKRIGELRPDSGSHLDGYLAEFNFIDGQVLDSSYFGFTDPVTNIWMPKRYEGTYGTNGFYLDFSDNSSTSTLGIDKSPNGNDFTVNNFSVASGKDGDSFIDTPTNNFSTLNSLVNSNTTQSLSDGNLTRSGGAKKCMATFEALNGKYYFEYKAEDGNGNHAIGVCQIDTDTRDRINTEAAAIFAANGEYKIENNSQTSGFAVWGNGDIISVAIDTTLATPKVWFAVNNSWQGASGDSGTFDPFGGYSLTAGKKYTFTVDHGSSSGSTTGTAFFGAHQGEFNYDPPSGFKTLSTKNLPPNVPSIVRPEKHFKCVAYSGTGSTQKIESLEFAPDLVWVKRRNASNYHILTDTVRGAANYLVPNNSDAESVGGGNQLVNAFFKNGFQVGTENAVNNSSGTYVAWCWKAGGATTVANTDGDQTTQISVNEEAGFSIVTYTGTGSNTNIGHGLGATPDIVITKSRSATGSWAILDTVGNSTAEYSLYLNDNGGYSSYQGGTFWNDTLPNSTVFRVSSNAATNASGVTYIAYCWRSIPGFSKFGTYKGNGNNDGPFIHTGFRPAWVTVKNTSASNNWQTWDNARETSNVMQRILEFNDDSTTDDASSNTAIDFLSNGFKHRTSFQRSNTDGGTYLYMAFAEQPGTTPFDTFPNAR